MKTTKKNNLNKKIIDELYLNKNISLTEFAKQKKVKFMDLLNFIKNDTRHLVREGILLRTRKRNATILSELTSMEPEPRIGKKSGTPEPQQLNDEQLSIEASVPLLDDAGDIQKFIEKYSGERRPHSDIRIDYQVLDENKYKEIISDLDDLPNISYLDATIENQTKEDFTHMPDWDKLEQNLNELDDFPNIPYLYSNPDRQSASTPLLKLENEVKSELYDILSDEETPNSQKRTLSELSSSAKKKRSEEPQPGTSRGSLLIKEADRELDQFLKELRDKDSQPVKSEDSEQEFPNVSSNMACNIPTFDVSRSDQKPLPSLRSVKEKSKQANLSKGVSTSRDNQSR